MIIIGLLVYLSIGLLIVRSFLYFCPDAWCEFNECEAAMGVIAWPLIVLCFMCEQLGKLAKGKRPKDG